MKPADPGAFAARPRARLRLPCAALTLAILAAGCASFVDVRKTDLLESARLRRLAIVPFATDLYVEKPADPHEGAVVCRLEGKRFPVSNVPDTAPRDVTAIFTHQLSMKGGYDLVLPREVTAFIERRGLDPSALGPKAFFGFIAEGLGVDAVIAGNVLRYDERRGSSFGAETPASIAIDIHLMDGRSGALLWEADYSESQATVSENAGSFGMFVQRGAKFLTINQLASWAVEQILEHFPEPQEPES